MTSAIRYSILSFLLVLFAGCESDDITNSGTEHSPTPSEDGNTSTEQSEWLIPKSKVIDGGPGKDGIPSIDDPQFIDVDAVNYLEAEDLVLGIKINNQVRAYPHKILDYHEIVNDKIQDLAFCITYCPLTGTGIGWNREINGTVTEFGVSGLIYKNNLIAYDRFTDSQWAQMHNLSVHGEYIGTTAHTLNIIETKWSTWKKSYPSSSILSTETGFSRDYDDYPYGDFKTDDDSFLFPVENEDDRLPSKDRVHGIQIDSTYVVYPIKEFGNDITVTNTEIKNEKVVVFGSIDDNMVESYFRTVDGAVIEFHAVQDQYPVVMEDQTGSQWNIFGEAVSGQREGTQLKITQSYNGYWYAFADFFPGLPILKPDPATSIP